MRCYRMQISVTAASPPSSGALESPPVNPLANPPAKERPEQTRSREIQPGANRLRNPNANAVPTGTGRVVYYVAQSLDGFIATSAGGVDWLPSPEGDQSTGVEAEDFGYSDFYERVGAIVMGAGTYEWIMASGADWPYTSVSVVVMTARSFPEHPGPRGMVRFRSGAPRQIVADLQAELSRNANGNSGPGAIWLLGGGELAASFVAADLIDEFQISVIPVLLGRGIALIEAVGLPDVRPLRWLETRSFPGHGGGVLLHIYERVRESQSISRE